MNEYKKGIMRKNLRDYFENNKTAYSYLFFAQVMASVIGLVFGAGFKDPHLNSYMHILLDLEFLLFIFLPVFFIIAALATFKYKPFKDKTLVLIFHLTFCGLVFVSAFLTAAGAIAK